MRRYFVYILASRSRALYIGMTTDIVKRVYQHKHRLVEGFSSKYNINRLVYYEEADTLQNAYAREHQLKGWLRAKKIDLIQAMNPTWAELSDGWYEEENQGLK
jgi:putative endonuclease